MNLTLAYFFKLFFHHSLCHAFCSSSTGFLPIHTWAISLPGAFAHVIPFACIALFILFSPTSWAWESPAQPLRLDLNVTCSEKPFQL